MSQFDTAFAAAGLPVLLFPHGQTVTLKGANVDDLSVTALVGPVEGAAVDGDRGREAETSRPVEVQASDVSTPGAWTRVTIGGSTGEDWKIISDPPAVLTESTIIYTVVRIGSAERSRPGYRPRGRHSFD